MSDHERLYRDGVLSTTSGQEPKQFDSPAPDPELGATGQHKSYWVLSEAERAKGFVRPVRSAYKHVGAKGPEFELRDLTEAELVMWEGDPPYAKFETYPAGYRGSAVGRYWTQGELDNIGKGCGTVTTMGRALSETYARNPAFYGATFCCGCSTHLPVGERGEFVWAGTNERVGT